MAINVQTSNGSGTVPGGADFLVDWPDNGGPEPGLIVLDKPESDPTAQWVAYYPPGQWLSVVRMP